MLYVLYGTDSGKSREKLQGLLKTLLSKKKDASLIRMDSENFDPTAIIDLASTQGLFESKSIIVFDSLFQNTTNKEIIFDHIKSFKESNNIFIILEGKLDAKTVAKLTKNAEKIQEFSITKINDTKANFTIFELSDALGKRDKKHLWVLYQTGKLQNFSDEEMHGILFWGVKNMILAKNATSPKESTLSPFVYKKASNFASNYSLKELYGVSGKLVDIYHQARRGEEPFDVGFERFILNYH